jgi:thiol-disulfide isomerase/thioredoxin
MRCLKSVFFLSFLMVMPALAVAVEIGQPAPACPMQSMSGNGSQVNFSQYKGKVAYVDFWASWCGPCAQSLPFLSELQAELQGQGLEVIAVNLDEDVKDAELFLAKHTVKLTTVTAPEGQCPEMFGVQAMPSSYLLDRQGKVRHVHLGFRTADKEEIRSEILALLAEK